ncbi:MAG: hypothetical protein IJX86_10275 [Lachnospiraceae bacterium]|nr:hypothetical protein [Lachnospiraceae bacterium]
MITVVQTDSLDAVTIPAADAKLSFLSSYSLAVAEAVSASNLILNQKIGKRLLRKPFSINLK